MNSPRNLHKEIVRRPVLRYFALYLERRSDIKSRLDLYYLSTNLQSITDGRFVVYQITGAQFDLYPS